MNKPIKIIPGYFSKKRVLITVLVFSFSLLGTAMYFLANQNNRQETDFTELVKRNELKDEFSKLSIYIKDAESANRGYALTGNLLFVQHFYSDIDSIQTTYLQIQNLQSRIINKQEGQLYLKADIFIAQKIAFMQQVKLLCDKGDCKQAVALIATGRGLMLSDSITAINNIIISQLNNRIKTSQSWFLSENDRNNKFSFVASLASMLMIILLFYFLLQEIKRTRNVSEELSVRKEHFRITLNSMGEGLITTDREGLVYYMNPVAEQLTGWSLEEAKHTKLRKVYHVVNEETGQPFDDIVSRILKNGEKIEFENNTILHSKNNNKYIISNNGAPILDEHGKISGAVVIFKDISEKKKAEQLIKASEEKYRNLVEQASDVIVIYSFDGTIHEFNNSACVLSGYNSEEFAKLKLTDILVGELVVNPDNYKAVMAGEIVTFSRQLKRKDGLLIELEVTVKMIADGKVIAFGRDITERKKAATKLEASEKKLRQVLSSTTDNFYVINRNYEVILINEVAEKNLLIAWGKSVKSGTNLLDVIPEKSEEPIKQSFEEVFKGNRIEYELMHSLDELPAWSLINFTPVIDENGEVIGAAVIAKNITERKKAENELKDSEETRRLIMNSALDAIVGMDTKGLITIWTPQAEKIFGWKEEEAVGKELSETIIPHQYREAHQRGLAHYMQSGKGPVLSKIIEITALRKGGQEFPIELAIVPVKKGEDEFFCAFIRDITEQKKAEETIQKERQLSDSVINSLPGVFYFYDENLKLLRWNKQLENVTGYTTEELKSMEPAELFTGEDRKYMQERSRKVFAAGSGDADASFTTKAGNKIPFYFTGVRMQYEGRPSLLGIGIDITDRKKAEEDIREKNKQLQLLSTHLQNIREEERTHMAREIHDELGQQMTMLKINASWLKDKLVDADEKMVQRSNELVNMLSDTIKTVRRNCL